MHFTVRRPKLSIRRPIPTVLLLVKRGTVQTTAVFSDTYLSFENRSANAQFWLANCKVHSLIFLEYSVYSYGDVPINRLLQDGRWEGVGKCDFVNRTRWLHSCTSRAGHSQAKDAPGHSMGRPEHAVGRLGTAKTARFRGRLGCQRAAAGSGARPQPPGVQGFSARSAAPCKSARIGSGLRCLDMSRHVSAPAPDVSYAEKRRRHIAGTQQAFLYI